MKDFLAQHAERYTEGQGLHFGKRKALIVQKK